MSINWPLLNTVSPSGKTAKQLAEANDESLYDSCPVCNETV